jgi:hypothetical protein
MKFISMTFRSLELLQDFIKILLHDKIEKKFKLIYNFNEYINPV